MNDLATTLTEALAESLCRLLVLSRPRDGAAGSDLKKVTLRPVRVRDEDYYQLAFRRADGKETHENLDPAAAIARVLELLQTTFTDCHVETARANIAIRVRPDGSCRIKRKQVDRGEAVTEHDRPKNYIIPEGTPCPFLAEIGVMTPAGKVRAARRAKFRQINRFLELVDDVLPALPPEGPLRVVDFGCGKSYLTFALHHLLRNVRGREVDIRGYDRKSDVVADCSRIAERLGCQGLEFRSAEIESVHEEGPVELVVSLHACDTATDDTLAQAVRWNAKVILAAPCCQHELSGLIESDALSPLLAHGILRERFAALATDALRAQALELCGYATQVVEFIDLEHTAKNLLIRAVRRPEPVQIDRKIADYQKLKATLGLQSIHLEHALGERFVETIAAPAADRET